MAESLDLILLETEERMEKAVKSTKRDLNSLRTGRAHPALLDRIQVEAYESTVPLDQVANISTPDAQTLAITPYDKSIIKNIQRAITDSDLGLTPNSDGELIRINIPQPTEERRKELSKKAKEFGEEGKVALRNIRRDSKDEIEDLEDAGEISEDAMHTTLEELDDLIHEYQDKIDDLVESKQDEIMEV